MIKTVKLDDKLREEGLCGDVSQTKFGKKVYHIWELNPKTPIFKQVRHEYSDLEMETAPEDKRDITEQVFYASLDLSGLSKLELQRELNNIADIRRHSADKSNPYYYSMVNIGTIEDPRWYPLPLLFAPSSEQEKANAARNYDPLPRNAILVVKERIEKFLEEIRLEIIGEDYFEIW